MKNQPLFLLWLVVVVGSVFVHGSESIQSNSQNGNASNVTEHQSIRVASWRYHFVKNPMIIIAFLLSIVLIKILFYHTPDCISKNVPESCLLMILGIILGVVFLFDPEDSYNFLFFDDTVFFLYLLPPIILKAAFSLRDRVFTGNIGTILLYAVFGTILNIILISFGLYGLSLLNVFHSVQVGLVDLLIFGSLIAAVDPVAVLAIFEEMEVNKILYFMVFGENLLNDAVAVVFYNLMKEFKQINVVSFANVCLAFATFICVAFGAMAIGLVFGVLTALLTKYTGQIRVLEPLVMFGMAYMSYLTAEMVHFSGSTAIICCGIIQSQFAAKNISSKSYISVHYFVKVASSISESLIFIILGVNIVNEWEFFINFDTLFTTFAMLLCLLSRFIVTFGMTYCINLRMTGIRHISLQEQFVISYGGLRGAISFALAFMLKKNVVAARDAFLGATYFIIFFSVFVQGITMKPLVKFLKIRKKNTDKGYRLFIEFNYGIVKNIMAGVENISGYKGHYHWAHVAQWFTAHFIRPAIQKEVNMGRGKGILELYQEVQFEDKVNDPQTTGGSIPQHMSDKEMEQLDESNLTNRNADAVLDMQDERNDAISKRSDEKTPVKSVLPNASDITTLKNIIMDPDVDDDSELASDLENNRHADQENDSPKMKKKNSKKEFTTRNLLAASVAPVGVSVKQQRNGEKEIPAQSVGIVIDETDGTSELDRLLAASSGQPKHPH